jgi:hypothetical protein
LRPKRRHRTRPELRRHPGRIGQRAVHERSHAPLPVPPALRRGRARPARAPLPPALTAVSAVSAVEPALLAARYSSARRAASARPRRVPAPTRPRSAQRAPPPEGTEPPHAHPRSSVRLPIATSVSRPILPIAAAEIIPPSLMGHAVLDRHPAERADRPRALRPRQRARHLARA